LKIRCKQEPSVNAGNSGKDKMQQNFSKILVVFETATCGKKNTLVQFMIKSAPIRSLKTPLLPSTKLCANEARKKKNSKQSFEPLLIIIIVIIITQV